MRLTAAGRLLVNKVTRHRRTAITRVLRGMNPEDRELLKTALDRFATAAGEPTPDDATMIWPGAR